MVSTPRGKFAAGRFSRDFVAALLYTVDKGGESMVVYWDLAAAWNFALDYILLLGTARLAGHTIRRGRLALGAALGATYSVAALGTPLPLWTLALTMLLECLIAFGRSARFIKLTLLFALLACSLGGGVLLLGRLGGGSERFAADMVYVRLPWGVFFAATGLSYLVLTVIFRNGAKRGKDDYVRVSVSRGGKSVEARLLRDTGNTLSDPLTGEGVPVIEKNVLTPLFSEGDDSRTAYGANTELRIRTVSGEDDTLEAFRCDELTVDGRKLGARLIAVSPAVFGGGYQGLWYGETESDCEGETEKHGLETTVGQDP